MDCEMMSVGSNLGSADITQRDKLAAPELEIGLEKVNDFDEEAESIESSVEAYLNHDGAGEDEVGIDSDESVVDEVIDSSPAASEVIVGDVCDSPPAASEVIVGDICDSPSVAIEKSSLDGDVVFLGDAISDDDEGEEESDVISCDEDVQITGDIWVGANRAKSSGEIVIEVESDESMEQEDDEDESEDDESDEVVEVEDEDSPVSDIEDVREEDGVRAASGTARGGAIAARILNDDYLMKDGDAVIEAPSSVSPFVYLRPKNESILKTWMDLRREELLQEGRSAEEVDQVFMLEVEETEKEEKKHDEAKQEAKPKGRKRRRKRGSESEDDDEWRVEHESSESESEPDSSDDVQEIERKVSEQESNAVEQYCEKPIGRFLLDVGLSLAQEFVALHALRMQKRALDKELTLTSHGRALATQALNVMKETLAKAQAENAHMKAPPKICPVCDFATTSETVMDWHLESPHVPHHCNFCPFTSTYPVVMMDHFRIKHKRKCRFEPTPESLATRMHCHLCPFEERVKIRFQRHVDSCRKRHVEKTHLDISSEFDPAAKNVPAVRGSASARTATTRNSAPINPDSQWYHFFVPGEHATTAEKHLLSSGGAKDEGFSFEGSPLVRGLMKPIMNASSRSTLQPSSVSTRYATRRCDTSSNGKSLHITSLRTIRAGTAVNSKDCRPDGSRRPKISCEICDGHITDLDQLGHHLKWIHKIYLHPRLLHSRPPLNCQKCQDRFFTDQGLERHLLGAHGLVTSSMSEAAKENKDAGRCPICGKMYRMKLIHHVSKDHKLSLKPAHLSYKCTVCTATFSLYRSFEQHVYDKHSSLAGSRSLMDGSGDAQGGPSGSNSPSLAAFRKPGFGGLPRASTIEKKDVEPITIDLSDDDDDEAVEAKVEKDGGTGREIRNETLQETQNSFRNEPASREEDRMISVERGPSPVVRRKRGRPRKVRT